MQRGFSIAKTCCKVNFVDYAFWMFDQAESFAWTNSSNHTNPRIDSYGNVFTTSNIVELAEPVVRYIWRKCDSDGFPFRWK